MANGKRDRALERRWRQLLAAWRRSGVSVRVFCDAEGVGESTFYFWRRELPRRQQEARKPAARPVFVPVRVRHDADFHANANSNSNRNPPPHLNQVAEETGIEIAFPGGAVIRVRRGFDRGLLREVVAALEGGA